MKTTNEHYQDWYNERSGDPEMNLDIEFVDKAAVEFAQYYANNMVKEYSIAITAELPRYFHDIRDHGTHSDFCNGLSQVREDFIKQMGKTNTLIPFNIDKWETGDYDVICANEEKVDFIKCYGSYFACVTDEGAVFNAEIDGSAYKGEIAQDMFNLLLIKRKQ